MFDGTLVKLIKFPAEHLTIFHGTLVFRGTPVENHWTRAPENYGENHDLSLEAPFTLSLAGHNGMLFFRCFFVFLVSGYWSGECCFLPSQSLACEISFHGKNILQCLNAFLAAICMYNWVSAFSTAGKSKRNVANQLKRNFYKIWRHEIRHRGPTVKIAPGPLPFNPALYTSAFKACTW